MEQEEVMQTRQEPAPERAPELIRKKLNLEWTESEWFRVWLKLARGEHDPKHSN